MSEFTTSISMVTFVPASIAGIRYFPNYSKLSWPPKLNSFWLDCGLLISSSYLSSQLSHEIELEKPVFSTAQFLVSSVNKLFFLPSSVVIRMSSSVSSDSTPIISSSSEASVSISTSLSLSFWVSTSSLS